jgi:hypothetical protein
VISHYLAHPLSILTIGLGLVIAVLADQVRYESVVKSVVRSCQWLSRTPPPV